MEAAAVSTPVIDEVRGTPVAMQPGGRSSVIGRLEPSALVVAPTALRFRAAAASFAFAAAASWASS